MKYKTTQHDVKYFAARVRHWQKALSLGDWKIEAYIGDCGENSAQAELWHNEHGAHIKLRETFSYKPGREFLNCLALHEVSHLLLCDLKRLIFERGSTEAQANTAEHAIIRRLENLLS